MKNPLSLNWIVQGMWALCGCSYEQKCLYLNQYIYDKACSKEWTPKIDVLR